MSDSWILIDTSVWILSLRKEGNPVIKERVKGLLELDVVAITPIIQLELLSGTRTKAEFERLKKRLKALHAFPIGESVWEKAALVAFDLRRKGKSVPYTDILIAAVAMLNDLILLHVDHHFQLISQEFPLKTQDLTPLA